MLGGGKWNRRFFSIQSTDLVYQADENAPIKGSVDLKVIKNASVLLHPHRILQRSRMAIAK
jgi:hypothetical protein